MSCPDFYTELTPKARKQHHCCECRGEIQKGEVYHKLQGMWEGDWNSFKHCQSCWLLIQTVKARLKKEGWDADDLSIKELASCIMEDGVKSEVELFMKIRKNRNAPESPKRWIELRAEKILGKEGA